MVEEYFDIVNENNEVIGTERRSVVHKSGLWHRGVHIFLFLPDRKLLVQKRGEAQDTFPGVWDCSVSEHLKVGESYLDGAIRGLREELGIEQIELNPLVLFKMNYGPNDNEICELYEGVLNDKPLTIDQQEIEQIAYYTIHELEEMTSSREDLYAPWFVQLLRWYTGIPDDMEVIWQAGGALEKRVP